MAVKPISINDFRGGLNLNTLSDIKDNQLSIAKNMFYNSKKQLQTRYGITTFGSLVGTNKPITSYHFFQRDDTGATQALCTSGTDMYKLDPTLLTRSSIKNSLTEYETATGKTTFRTRWDFAVYKNKVYCTNGVDAYAEYDGTTYTATAMPKIRYVNMNTDRIYGAGEDLNPSTIYYTDAAPVDGKTFTTNAVVVGGDELGRINGLNELQNAMLALKSGKIYSVDVTNEKADPIDSQTGGFSDRTIANVGNTLVYLTERGVDTLKPRSGVAGGSSLESESLDQDVRVLTAKIQEANLNSNCALYIKKNNNYIISFDTDGNDIPDTTLVYNSLVKAWTQYTYPNLYDYGFYITSTGQRKYIATSGVNDQCYEIETGFDDLGETIEHEIQTKAFDFGEPGTYKTYDYIDVIGKKSKGFDLEATAISEFVTVGGGMITDTAVISNTANENLGVRTIGVDSLTGTRITEDVQLFDFVARIPLYTTGTNISLNLKSLGGSWILEKIRIGVNGEPIDVYGYNNIV